MAAHGAGSDQSPAVLDGRKLQWSLVLQL